MTGVISDLFIEYPVLLYLLIALSCLFLPVLLLLAVISFAEGREFSTPLFKIGPKVHSPHAPAALEGVSEKDLDKAVTRVRQSLEDYSRTLLAGTQPAVFEPAPLPDRTLQLIALKLTIDRRVRDIVFAQGGHWAGSSLAPFSAFYSLAKSSSVIPEDVLREIEDLETLLIPGVYGDPMDDDQFRDTQRLAAKIMQDLDEVPPGPHAG